MAGSSRAGDRHGSRDAGRLRGGRRAGSRRWPWALAATAAGGAAGAVVALVMSRRRGGAAVEVQEPDEVRAVVDSPAPLTSEPTA